MGFFSTAAISAIASTVGKPLMTEASKMGIAWVKNQLQPDEMVQILKRSIESAQTAEAAKSPTSGLFHGFQPKAGEEFLAKFLRSSVVFKELQQPLQDDGKPNVDILVAAFEAAAQADPAANKYLQCLRPWLEAFVESYFQQIKGICFQVAKKQYLRQLARRVDDVKFVGIAVPGKEVERQEVLAQIFVMPDVREEKLSQLPKLDKLFPDLDDFGTEVSSKYGMQDELLEEQKSWAMRDRSASRISAARVFDRSKQRAVILGAPGSGKTMLASYFALMLCKSEQNDPSQIGLDAGDWLPVVVRIRDWTLEPKMGLLEYLRLNAETNLYAEKLSTGFFEHWLDRGQALILLDGLDEVVEEAQRRKVAEQIETFLHRYQDNPAIITSRPAGYRWDFFKLDEFPHYTLEPFDDEQVAVFIDHWYDSRIKDNRAQAERRKAELKKAFERNDRIKLLAKNPLLLTIIALIHRYQAELPRRRCNLYEAAVKTLLTNWDSEKEINHTQDFHYLKQDDLLYILKKIAYWIHTQGSVGETEGGTLIKKDKLIEQLRKEIQTRRKCEFDEAETEAERFIDFIQKRTGLLNEQGRDRYAFVHKTFQEYLTAEEIYYLHKRQDDTGVILDHFKKHLHDQHWREVLLLLVSQLEGEKARKAIQTILDAKSKYEQWLHRDLLFAGWCLTEDPPELIDVAPELVGEILDRLVDLEVGKSDWIGSKIRSGAENIIHCFGGTNVAPILLAKLKVQKDRVDPFRWLDFQISLGQEAKVIEQLLERLEKGDQWGNLDSAVSALVQLGNSGLELENRLIYFLKNESSEINSKAALVLFRIGSKCPELEIHLLSLLTEGTSDNQVTTASKLAQIGSKNPKIEKSLLSLLTDQSPDVRFKAASILIRMENKNPAIEASLLSLLTDQNPEICCGAASTLIRMESKSPEAEKSAEKSLLSLLTGQSPDVRFKAASILIRMENKNPAIEASLLSLLTGQSPDARFKAASTLSRMENKNPAIEASLLSLLDHKSSLRSKTVSVLIQMGDNSSELKQRLLSLLTGQNQNVKASAALVLIQMENDDSVRETVRNNLLPFLAVTQSDIDVKISAASVLIQMKDQSPEIKDSLISLLKNRTSSIRSKVVLPLSQLSKISNAVLPEVVELLESNQNGNFMGEVIDCLYSIIVE